MADKEANTEVPKTGVVIPLDVRCGHCYHYNKQRAERYADICEKLGILKIARPCPAFMTNVNTLSLKDEQDQSFANLIAKIPSVRLVAYAALINQERTTRRCGYRLGQVVYVRLLPNEYVSNYAKAWVLLAKKNMVIVQGEKGFRGSFLRTSILTEAEFDKKRQSLLVRKRKVDPNFQQYLKWSPQKTSKDGKENVPTIDDVTIKEQPKTRAKKSNVLTIRNDQ